MYPDFLEEFRAQVQTALPALYNQAIDDYFDALPDYANKDTDRESTRTAYLDFVGSLRDPVISFLDSPGSNDAASIIQTIFMQYLTNDTLDSADIPETENLFAAFDVDISAKYNATLRSYYNEYETKSQSELLFAGVDYTETPGPGTTVDTAALTVELNNAPDLTAEEITVYQAIADGLTPNRNAGLRLMFMAKAGSPAPVRAPEDKYFPPITEWIDTSGFRYIITERGFDVALP